MSRFAENPAYVEHEELLRGLHVLIASGQGDSAQADAIRDAMDDTYLALSQEERDRLGGLSADLYMLSDEEIYEKRPPELSSDEALRREAERAYRANDWSRILQLMRYGMPWFSPGQLAIFRGRQYERLGHLRTACLFYEKAVKIEPHNANYAMIMLHSMEMAGNIEAALQYATKAIADDNNDPRIVVAAAGILQSHVTGEKALQTNRELIPRLESAIDQIRSTDEDASPMELVCGIAIMAGCYRNIGEIPKAIEVWSQALQIDDGPNKWLDHVALGQLKLELGDPDGAEVDFQHAVELNSQAGLPYLFLAHREFDKGHYSEVLTLMDKALELKTSPAFQARCWELKAITQSELNINPKRVRQSFERAMGLNPFNETIRQNFAVFTSSLSGDNPKFATTQIDPDPGFDPVAHSRFAVMADIEYITTGQAA